MHPEQPGNTVDREAFERIWRHSVLLLQRGFKEGSILTVDPAEAKILGPPWTRRLAHLFKLNKRYFKHDCKLQNAQRMNRM